MIAENLHRVISTLREGVTLVAVSKFHSVGEMMEAYRAGQRVFGENRPQELSAKVPQMPSDVVWHFIGHLQTNKLGKVLPYAAMVESVDSLHLLEAVSAWCEGRGKVMDILLELHLGAEETKGGFSAEEIREVLGRSSSYPGVRFCGLMGMATNTPDEAVVRADFRRIADIRADLYGTSFRFGEKEVFTALAHRIRTGRPVAHLANMLAFIIALFPWP